MVIFVDQDKMTPVQLALETARYEFCKLHGATISYEGNDYKYVLDATEAINRIEAAFEYLAKSCGTET